MALPRREHYFWNLGLHQEGILKKFQIKSQPKVTCRSENHRRQIQRSKGDQAECPGAVGCRPRLPEFSRRPRERTMWKRYFEIM